MSGGLTYRRSYVKLSLAKMTKESKVFHTNKTPFPQPLWKLWKTLQQTQSHFINLFLIEKRQKQAYLGTFQGGTSGNEG